MKKVLQMIMSVAVMVAMLVGNSDFTCLVAEAAEAEDVELLDEAPEVLEAEVVDIEEGAMPYTALAQCIISISGDDDGMYIDITTGTIGTASVIGVKDIKIQRKFWYGWSLVATSSGGEINDRTMMAVSITYANAVKDATYRITCIHYGDTNGYTEAENDTGAFVFTY